MGGWPDPRLSAAFFAARQNGIANAGQYKKRNPHACGDSGETVKKPRRIRGRKPRKMEICFRPGRVSGRKHFSRSARRIGRLRRTTEAQSEVRFLLSKKAAAFFDRLTESPRMWGFRDVRRPLPFFRGALFGYAVYFLHISSAAGTSYKGNPVKEQCT